MLFTSESMRHLSLEQDCNMSVHHLLCLFLQPQYLPFCGYTTRHKLIKTALGTTGYQTPTSAALVKGCFWFVFLTVVLVYWPTLWWVSLRVPGVNIQRHISSLWSKMLRLVALGHIHCTPALHTRSFPEGKALKKWKLNQHLGFKSCQGLTPEAEEEQVEKLGHLAWRRKWHETLQRSWRRCLCMFSQTWLAQCDQSAVHSPPSLWWCTCYLLTTTELSIAVLRQGRIIYYVLDMF